MHTALVAVIASDLDQPAKLAFAALYAHTNGTGAAELPVADVLALLRIRHAGTLRELRQRLAAAGYLTSSVTDGVLHWQITARPTAALADDSAAHSRAQDDTARPTAALNDEQRGPQPRSTTSSAAHSRAQDDTARPTAALADDSAAHSRAQDAVTGVTPPPSRAGARVNNYPLNVLEVGGGDIKSSYLPEGGAGETTAAERLLIACGVRRAAAAELAAGISFRAIVAQVAAWQADDTVRGAGALISRLADGWGVSQAPTDAWRAGILRQHVSAAQLAAWQAEERAAHAAHLPAAAVPPPPPAPAPTGPAADLWAQLVNEFASDPAVARYLQDTHGLRLAGTELVVAVPDAARGELLHRRLAPRIIPRLITLAGRGLTIRYEVEHTDD